MSDSDSGGSNGNNNGNSNGTDKFRQIKNDILSKLNIKSEYEALGVKFDGRVNKRGWAACWNPYRSEQHPSCGINLTDPARLGQFVSFNMGTGAAVWARSFFDVASELTPGLGGDFLNTLQHYAKRAGVEVHTGKREIDRQYDYTDTNGNLVFQVIRYKGRKDFRPRRPDGTGGWIYDLPEAQRVPYALHRVAATDTVYIAEGEKDCQTLESLGLVASTNPFGAGKWIDEYDQYFSGKHIVILRDNDDPGKAHQELVARHLQLVAASVRLIDLPDVAHKEDVTDWISKGHTAEELAAIVGQAQPIEAAPADQAEDHIAEFNRIHAVVMIGGKFLILTEIQDPIFKRPDITLSSVSDFSNYYANRKIYNPAAGRMQPASRLWLESQKRREYKSIIFDPSRPQSKPGEYYNLYRGLAVQPKAGDWSLYRDHIYNIICSRNDSLYTWVTAWMARIVKDPGGRRPGTSIALRGKQGAGKGCFVGQFGRLFGPHFVHLTNQNQLIGHFNFHLKDALLLFADEGFWAGDKGAEGTLKGMVTEDIQFLTPKGKESFPVKNFINLIISSNHDWVVPAGLEERRFCVIDVAATHMQDHAYFERITQQMNSGGREAMLNDLLKMNISQVNLRKIPQTNALLEQKLNSLNSVGNFWYERLLDGVLLAKDSPFDDWITSATVAELHGDYIKYCERIGTRFRLNSVHFSQNIQKLCPGIQRRSVTDAGKTKRMLYIPELTQCREQFSGIVGMKIDWNGDLDNFEIYNPTTDDAEYI